MLLRVHKVIVNRIHLHDTNWFEMRIGSIYIQVSRDADHYV